MLTERSFSAQHKHRISSQCCKPDGAGGSDKRAISSAYKKHRQLHVTIDVPAGQYTGQTMWVIQDSLALPPWYCQMAFEMPTPGMSPQTRKFTYLPILNKTQGGFATVTFPTQSPAAISRLGIEFLTSGTALSTDLNPNASAGLAVSSGG